MLIDFGLVRVRHSEQTRVGMAVGTPSYMAPEQARCAPDLDARADVFSLGCVLFKCLTGRLPFEGPDALTVLSKILF
ncbi:protein kinase domain-containing protein, partial [Bacillus atrophaeus]|uniref:protein kinase domain-containing protein n=1 Tax=Bacillus atrophaeus TaxID=1452 RepID=UPI003BF56CFA